MKRYGKDFTLTQETMDAIASYMQDDTRELIHEEYAPCDPADFLAIYLDCDPYFEEVLNSEFDIDYPENEREAHKIAMSMRENDTWIDYDCHRLCELAGIGSEYDAADGDLFETVVFKAAEILNVDIQ